MKRRKRGKKNKDLKRSTDIPESEDILVVEGGKGGERLKEEVIGGGGEGNPNS